MQQPHEQRLEQLVGLCRELGREERELAILGEGNVSCDCGDGTFWIKASGASLGSLVPEDVSRVRLDEVLAFLAEDAPTEADIERKLVAALAASEQRKPSVETFMHAICLTVGEAKWVAHVHSTAINKILCSRMGAQPFLQHVFPDAIVVCGAQPAVIPYVDPGFRLAAAVRSELLRYREAHGVSPKLLLMANHGPVSLGSSAREALNIMLMADKWARVLLGTFALGGPAYLPAEEVSRIDNRIDEQYRRGRLREEEAGSGLGRGGRAHAGARAVHSRSGESDDGGNA
jgi:rhamnose utilization protein RhaD (predicted bifunctional aldolase and dehydrogenase)